MGYFRFSGESDGAFTFSSNLAVPSHMNERDLLFVLCLAPVAYLFKSLRKLGRKWWGAYFRFVFCSALEINEPPPLFVLCLVPNAICFQLFKFSGKSGGAFTFPSNFPDLPHMSERFPLFVFCLANSRKKNENIRQNMTYVLASIDFFIILN